VSAAARAVELRRRLEQAAHEYYVLDRPSLSDFEYDKLFRELQALERDHPELRDADSPTARVGRDVSESHLAKHTHLVPMASLDNAFDETELGEWEDAFGKLVGEAVAPKGTAANSRSTAPPSRSPIATAPSRWRRHARQRHRGRGRHGQRCAPSPTSRATSTGRTGPGPSRSAARST
jgi:DNA ligase (NAD+)